MSTEENEAVVRRFITEVLEGGDLDTIDDVLAPDHVNTAMGVTDPAGFKAMWAAMGAVIPSMRLDIVDLVAEGDAVVARVTTEIIVVNGKRIDGRGLAYSDGSSTCHDGSRRGCRRRNGAGSLRSMGGAAEGHPAPAGWLAGLVRSSEDQVQDGEG